MASNTQIVGKQLFLEEQTASAKTLIVNGRIFLVPATAGGGGATIPIFHRHYAGLRSS